jgi:hypothetical protein
MKNYKQGLEKISPIQKLVTGFVNSECVLMASKLILINKKTSINK